VRRAKLSLNLHVPRKLYCTLMKLILFLKYGKTFWTSCFDFENQDVQIHIYCTVGSSDFLLFLNFDYRYFT
jgi:hypothetical protein